jgi:radical SAM superfamily enzyme YgiQ (UPF0313 family)
LRVCLISPPSPFELDERVFCALGILKIASVLEREGHQVDHIDLSGVENFEEAVRDYSGDAKVFGITSTTPQFPSAVRVTNVLREVPGRKVILGGPHPTLLHSAYKREKHRADEPFLRMLKQFDVVVAGDGEDAIFSAISPFSRGVIDADDPKSPMWQTSQKFTDSPWPARHLVDLDTYHYSIDGARALHLISQLGCPMACFFCAGRNSSMLRRIRNRPPENVISEILYLHKTYGYTGFNFFDDELNINKSMVDLMRKLRQESDRLGVEWKLRGFVKAELFTEEQAKVMYDAGFRWILTGFESGSERILVNIHKNATRADNTRCMELAHSHGLKVKALMSIGHAGESYDTINETYEWLLETKPDELDVTVITPYPGSPYWDDAEEVGSGVWKFVSAKTGDALYMNNVDFTETADYYKGIPGEYVSHVWTDHISAEELVVQRDWLEKESKSKLGIKMISPVPAMHFEHSMGMSPQILRSSITEGV